MAEYVDLLDKVSTFQNLFIARATGGTTDAQEFLNLRRELTKHSLIGPLLPRFVHTSRDLDQFWLFIQPHVEGYAARRVFIREGFEPALSAAERGPSPLADDTGEALKLLSSERVRDAWRRALARQSDDPEGAITLARSLLESVCKHILEDCGQEYAPKADMPKLYRQVATQLQLAPDQHTDDLFRRILGGCTSVVEGLGSLRSKVGDAHGTGRRPARPSARHAALAVNLAGAMAAFIVATWEARKPAAGSPSAI